jgi:hypothetical protein
MKNALKLLVYGIFCLSITFLVGCDTTDEGDVNNFSAEDSVRAAQLDNIVDGSFNITENAFEENEGETLQLVTSLFPSCATITISPNGDGTGMIIIDFGSSCQLNNGAMVSGAINLDYLAIVNASRNITYTYENFTYNGHGVAGGGTIQRELSNNNGNPQSTVTENITVSFQGSDITGTRVGVRTTEWVEGFGSGTWEDNVYHINGNWETTLSNGFSRTGEVIETLVKKLSCLYLVEGTLEVNQSILNGVLNFGDGECDNQATLTINGIAYPIVLN